MPAPQILTGPTFDYQAGARVTEKLDRGLILREIAIRLTIGVDDDGTNAIDAASLSPAGIWGIVQNLRLKLNSNTNIRDISGDTLKLLNFYYYNVGDYEEANIIAAAGSGPRTVVSTLILPLWMVDSIKPIDTQLDARLLSNLELSVDWGEIGDITDATGATISTNPVIEIGTLNTFGINGPFNTQILSEQRFTDIAANSRFQVELATGNLYRSILVGVQDSDGNDEAGLIDNIRVRSGGKDFFNVPATLWRAWSNKRERNFVSQRDVANDVTTVPFVSGNRDLDAWFYMDFVTDGHLSESINAIGMSELKLEFDINSQIDNLIIVPQEIVPLANNNGGGNGGN